MSAPSSGLSTYASKVAARLRGLPADQRREVADDVQQRLADMGITSWDTAVAQLGAPEAYAEELREAAGWPRSRRRRWTWAVLAVAVLAIVVGVAWPKATAVPEDYPLVFGSRMQSGAGSTAGSVIVMPDHVGEPILVGVEVQNQGDRTVRLDGVQSFVGATADGGMVIMGSDAGSPLWAPDARVFGPMDPVDLTLRGFDDPSGSELAGFSVAPGATVVLQLQGPVLYCVEAAQGTAVGDHIRLDVTIAGERRVVTGTELSFPLSNCS